MKVKRALISVTDKTGLEEFVKALDKLGVEILSTGGTAKAISSLGIPVTEVSSYTGFPEMMDGRVKTLHPKIHAGLLALRENADHMRQAKEHGIELIDMVVVNLYAFEKVTSRKDVTIGEAVENIDIGGPSMLRSAAKNFKSVAVVSAPSQYGEVLAELERGSLSLSEKTLKKLAAMVFEKTSRYDGRIAEYLSGGKASGAAEEFPPSMNIKLEKVESELRYGENPHQGAALYRDTEDANDSIIGAEQFQGKQLSFNNMLDLSVAAEIVKSFSSPSVSIIKHNNPCGVASADTLEKAFQDALDCDRMSAFGSIMGFNGSVSGKLAELILGEVDFLECIIAPEYDAKALEIFKAKKNLRILKSSFLEETSSRGKDFKKIPGGFLVQDADTKEISSADLKIVTHKKPSEEVIDSLLFGWKVVRFLKSNAILLCQGTKTVGVGVGQMSRIDSVITAVRKAGDRARGAILASDAFFPKPDSIEQAHKAGVAAIIQPGGSIKDDEVIATCDLLGMPMVFTGARHFRH